MKVLLSVPLNPVTGYGCDGLETVRAFLRWGADVYVFPSSVLPPLPRDIAAVLTKPIPPVVDLLISHKCPQELASAERCGIFSIATVSLAWSMWEWNSLNGIDIIDHNNCEHSFKVLDHLQDSFNRFDAVLAYDEVSREAFNPYCDNIHVLQGGVTPLPYMRRDWFASPFRFLMCGVISARKNPMASVKAFKKLRDAGELQDATLTVKSSHPGGLHPAMEQWCPGLKLINELWPIERLYELYRECHVLLAPSWGEGKNRPAIEFATSGGVVVAPMIGGHAQWMSPDYTFPVDYTLKDYGAGAYGADVDVDHLAEIMLHLYTNRDEARECAENASRSLPSVVNWDAVLERLCLRLGSIAGARGEEVASLMRACRRNPQSEAIRTSVTRAALDPVDRSVSVGSVAHQEPQIGSYDRLLKLFSPPGRVGQ